ncbi:MAG TPA: hypothetical protein VKF62_06995, partial [Planctomycetota bacterium]|nr:hypothetical protein [Planctomycetota bacterium]
MRRAWNIGKAIRQRSYMAKQAQRAAQPPPPPSTSIGLAAFSSGPKTAVRVSLDRHEGRQFVNVRSWY